MATFLSHWRPWSMALALLGTFVSSSCAAYPKASADSNSVKSTQTTCPTATCRVVAAIRQANGIACSVNGVNGPTSFLVSEELRAVKHKLHKSDLVMARSIAKYVRSSTFRYTVVEGDVLMFDAEAGPCTPNGLGYAVLNASSCNEYYAPTDPRLDGMPGRVSAPPGGCFMAPRPWIKHDGGRLFEKPWKKRSP